MSITNSQLERLNDFMDANMTEEEMLAFEIELGDNNEIAEMLAFEQSIRDVYLIKNFEGVKDDAIDNIESTNFLIKPKSKKYEWFNNSIKFAAAAILILCLGLYIFWPKKEQPIIVNNKPTDTITQSKKDIDLVNDDTNTKIDTNKANNHIAEAYASKINIDSIFKANFRIELVPEIKPIEIANELEMFEKEQYLAFENLNIENLSQTRGNQIDKKTIELAYLYKGLGFLINNKPKEAIENFNNLEANSTNENQKSLAIWYKALCFLKTNEMDKCISQLNKASNYPRYKNDAAKLLAIIKY